MTAPLWGMIGYGVMTVVAYAVSGFICGGDELPDRDQNTISLLLDFATFQGCSDVPGWFGYLLFVVFGLPWIILAIVFLTPIAAGAFANPIAGTILALATIGVIVSVYVALVT